MVQSLTRHCRECGAFLGTIRAIAYRPGSHVVFELEIVCRVKGCKAKNSFPLTAADEDLNLSIKALEAQQRAGKASTGKLSLSFSRGLYKESTPAAASKV